MTGDRWLIAGILNKWKLSGSRIWFVLLNGKRQDNILHLAEHRCSHIFHRHQWNAAPQSQNMNTVGLTPQQCSEVMETFLLSGDYFICFYLIPQKSSQCPRISFCLTNNPPWLQCNHVKCSCLSKPNIIIIFISNLSHNQIFCCVQTLRWLRDVLVFEKLVCTPIRKAGHTDHTVNE